MGSADQCAPPPLASSSHLMIVQMKVAMRVVSRVWRIDRFRCRVAVISYITPLPPAPASWGTNRPAVSSCVSYEESNWRHLMPFLCGVVCKRTLIIGMEVRFCLIVVIIIFHLYIAINVLKREVKLNQSHSSDIPTMYSFKVVNWLNILYLNIDVQMHDNVFQYTHLVGSSPVIL